MESLRKQAARILGEQRKYKIWLTAFLCLALLVTAGTVAALTLSGQALTADEQEKELDCQVAVHRHTEQCYDSEGGLICGQADYVIHTHDESCYGEEGELVCTLAEMQAEGELHVHDAACFTEQQVLTCGQEESQGHQHGEECYTKVQGELICEAEGTEHQHGPECYEKVKGDLTCTTEESGHQHSPECYTKTKGDLTCGKEESQGHQHSPECYTKVKGDLTCTAGEGHQHGAECYTKVKGDLTCTSQEEGHEHTDECYAWNEELTCGQTEESHEHTDECYAWTEELTCGQTEEEPHTHTDECYAWNEELTCGQTEEEGHTHTDECYAWTEELTCEIPEGLHEHTDECYAWTEELTCETAEGEGAHTHTEECYETQTVCSCGQLAAVEHVHGEECFKIVETEEPVVLQKVYQDSEVRVTAVYGEDANIPEEAQLVAEVIARKTETQGQVIQEQENQNQEPETPDQASAEAEPAQTESRDLEVPEAESVQTEAGTEPEEAGQEDQGIEPVVDEQQPEGTETAADGQAPQDTPDTQTALETGTEAEPGAENAGGDEKVTDQASVEDGNTSDDAVEIIREEVSYRLWFVVNGETVRPEGTVTFTVQCLDGDGNAAGAPVVLVYNAGDAVDAVVATLVRETMVEILSDELTLFQTKETANYIVTVNYAESARIPEGAQLQVIEYSKDSEQYMKRCEELGYQPDWLLNVGFFVEGEEVEPKTPVSVKVTDKNVTDAAEYEIVHFADTETEKMTGNGTKTGSGVEAEFTLNSFSDVAGTSTYTVDSDSQLSQIAPIGGLAHEKKVKPVPGMEDVYELTLNVKGAIGSIKEKAKLDILFVVDTSGSMDFDVDGHEYHYNKTRQALVNEQITMLVNSLENDDAIDARYKLVTFASTASTRNASSWQSGATLINRLPGDASGGTNYQDALEKAGAAVSADKRDAKRIIIFLTDGAPTYYNSGRGVAGPGSSTNTTCVTKAVEGAGMIGSDCDYFYAVGFGADMTRPTTMGSSGKTALQILTDVAEAAKNSGAGESFATASTDLTKFFEQFQANLKKIIAVDVSFTDRLTNVVYIVDDEGSKVENPGADNWECGITNADGNEAFDEISVSGMKAEYDSVNGLNVTFNSGYELKENYTYSVTAKIKINKEAADPEYRINGYSYPDRGEANTGADSEGQLGFFCNVEDSAKVEYSYKIGDAVVKHDPLEYPRPVVQMTTVPTPEPIRVQEMGHNKYVTKVAGATDLYDLTLDITGEVATGKDQKPAKYDVMFVVDTSGSMNRGVNTNNNASIGYRRIDDVRTAINNLIDQLAEKKIDAQYNLVTFASSAKPAIGWQSGNGVKKYIKLTTSGWGGASDTSNLAPSGGTNYQDGLVKAANGMGGTRSDATRVVIFLTDGQPTFHVCEATKGIWGLQCGPLNNNGIPMEGGGNETEDDDFNGAIMGAGALAGKADSFYAIGFGKDMNSNTIIYTDNKTRENYTAKQLLEKVRVATGIQDGKVDATNDLAKYFNAIIETIVQYNCDNVTITDILSQWAEIDAAADVPGVPQMLKVALIDKDTGAEISSNTNKGTDLSVTLPLPKSTDANNTNPNGGSMTATYNEAEKKVELDFTDDYKLEAGYSYAVTIRIKPTEAAYEEFKNGSTENIREGEAGTGETSAGKEGFYSNNTAKVKFDFKGETGKETEYSRPVIQPSAATIVVTKKIVGLEDLTAEEKAGIIEKLRFIFDDETTPIPLTKNENGTYSITKTVTPGRHTVTELWESADIPNMLRTTTITINGVATALDPSKTGGESAEDALFDQDAKVTIADVPANGTVTVAFTNTYEPKTQTVKLLKVDGDNKISSVFDGLDFTIRAGEITEEDWDAIFAEEPEKREEKLKDLINEKTVVCKLLIDSDGYAKVDKSSINEEYMKADSANSAEIELNIGNYIVVEDRVEKPLIDYYTVYPFLLKVLDSKVEMGTISESREIDGKVVGIRFPNDENVILTDNEKENSFELQVKNRRMVIDTLQIVKVNAQSNEKGYPILDGAKFNLYQVTKGESGDTIETLIMEELEAVNGKIVINNSTKKFAVGETYLLRETKAPDGFILSANDFVFNIKEGLDSKVGSIAEVVPTDHSFFTAFISEDGKYAIDATNSDTKYTVDDNGKVWTIAIPNNTGAQLPVTGGTGTAMYTLGGLAFIATSLVYGLSMRRKKEKGGQH